MADKKQQDKSEWKVLKAWELGWFGGGGFLSGMWFWSTETTKKETAKPEKEKVNLDEYFWTAEPEQPVATASDIFNFASHSSGQKKKKSFDKPEKKSFDKEKKDSHKNSKPKWNIQIEHAEYVAKEKNTESGSDFFESIRRQNAEKAQREWKQPVQSIAKKNNKSKSDKKHRWNEKPTNERAVQVIQASTEHHEATTSANLVKKSELFMDDKISVKEFSEKMWVSLIEIMKKLMENKIMTWINSSLDFDTASLIWAEFGVEVKKKEAELDMESFMSGDLQKILDLDKEAPVRLERAPVVTVMGHVDHWKTSLLDYLRKTSMAEWEAGWITQSIWASVVEYNGKKITFIDTPGHELFTSLRARWAKLTNIAVIVVAADDSVMPQTIESINHAKAAWVPIIIAITKIDKPGHKRDQIIADIAAQWLTPEEWWGDVPVIWVSSKTGEWIDKLLENILLQAEMLELKYNPNRSAVWVVLDSYKDAKQWVIASIIVLTGTLQVGNIIMAYNTYGKIKRMQNWKWAPIQKATWWEPVQILWFTELPEAWRIVEIVNNEKEAQHKVSVIQEQEASHKNEWAVQEFLAQLKAWWANNKVSELRLILKAEWASSLEALQQAVQWLELPKNVTIKVIHADVWQFSESDVSLGQVSKALLIWFNVSINAILKKKAEQQKVEIKSFDIIYELTDYLLNLLQWMVEVEKQEVTVGKLDVLGIFFTQSKEMTIGWMVIEWRVKNKLRFRVHRWEDIICNWEILSLQRNKDQVKEVIEWEDCGMKVKTGKKIQEHDILEFYELQDVVEKPEEKKAE